MSVSTRPAEDAPQTTARRTGRLWLRIIPLLVFVGLVIAFGLQIANPGDPDALPSTMIGRAAPDMTLPPLDGLSENGAPVPGFSTASLQGRVTLVNFWASWCGPCRLEHPYLTQLARDDRIQLVGINYRDNAVNALYFLNEFGNPFDAVGVDPAARNAIEWGTYAPPESFLIDADGVIRYKKVGNITDVDLRNDILPLIERLTAPAPAREG